MRLILHCYLFIMLVAASSSSDQGLIGGSDRIIFMGITAGPLETMGKQGQNQALVLNSCNLVRESANGDGYKVFLGPPALFLIRPSSQEKAPQKTQAISHWQIYE